MNGKIVDHINHDRWDRAIALLDNIERPILNGNNIMHLACNRGKYQVIKHLEKLGADIASPNMSGDTGLHILFKNGWGNRQIIRKMTRDQLTKINEDGEIVADLAIDNPDLLRRIIDQMKRHDCLGILGLDGVNFVYKLIDRSDSAPYLKMLTSIISESNSADFLTKLPILIMRSRKKNFL